MTNLEAALEYIKKGMSVIPLAKDKKPLMPWQEYQNRYATSEEINSWQRKWPDCNIGIVTGKISNLTVIDCDSQTAIESFYSGYKGKTPCVKTPKGMHFYFAYQEGVRNTARLTDHIDVRSEGGYVVAPPSKNIEGVAYRFVNDLSFALDSFSSCFLYKYYTRTREEVSTNVYKIPQGTVLFEHGRRDEDLFHIANCMIKGGAEQEYIYETLRRVVSTWGEQDEKWIQSKIESATQRAGRKERNLAAEVEEWILSTSGNFLSTEIYNCLQTSTRDDKKNISIILKRLLTAGIIEKWGERNGSWRKVETDVEYIDWQNAPEEEYSLELPLNIHKLAKLYPGNIAVLAGSSNTGKTSFMLETIRLNQKTHPVVYMNSEMGASELRLRLQLFTDINGKPLPMDTWKFKAMERSSNFADVIEPDSLNIIDFMEVYEDFWKVGGWIRDIHSKLKSGIAFIAIQKKTSTRKDKQDYGRGGELTLEKPRLYLAMDRGKIKVVKAKIWRKSDRNPNGLTRQFNIINGWKILSKSGWESEEERKYGFISEEDTV